MKQNHHVEFGLIEVSAFSAAEKCYVSTHLKDSLAPCRYLFFCQKKTLYGQAQQCLQSLILISEFKSQPFHVTQHLCSPCHTVGFNTRYCLIYLYLPPSTPVRCILGMYIPTITISNFHFNIKCWLELFQRQLIHHVHSANQRTNEEQQVTVIAPWQVM